MLLLVVLCHWDAANLFAAKPTWQTQFLIAQTGSISGMPSWMACHKHMSDTQACMENYDHVLSGINDYDTFLHQKSDQVAWQHGYDTLHT